jgi:RNA polymerase sigma factor (sigma-70 family)
MARGQLSTVVRHLHRLGGECQDAEAGDGLLLERFAARQDQAAFTALVRRHGPMVLGVCRRVLGNAHDAEDAFQATFLILVRKAGSIRSREALGGWLHEVALRVARRARTSANNRRRHEQKVPDMPRKDFLATVVWRDLQPVLDEEVQGLPDACREAFVLCCLEGKTYEQAADELHCRAGTISRRLAKARELLRTRLARRGLVLPAGLLATALSQKAAPAAVPAPLIASTVKAALLSAAGAVAAGAIPAQVVALAEGGLKAMTTSKTKMALALLITTGLALAGAAALAQSAPAGGADGGQKKPAVRAAQGGGLKTVAPRPDGNPPKEPDDPASSKLVVSGQVLNADGKPVAAASVALVGQFKLGARGGYRREVVKKTLAEGKADREGKFRLSASGVSAPAYVQVIIMARASGHGITQERLSAESPSDPVKLYLPGERILRGRLVDLQGQPAPRITVRLKSANGKIAADRHLYLYAQHAAAGASYWPEPVVSDAQGRFTLRGLPARCDLTLAVQGEGAAFAPQSVQVSGDGAPEKEVALALAPGRVLEGTITYRDTGKPVPNARLQIESRKNMPSGGWRTYDIEVRADAAGRYRAVPHEAETFVLTAYPPAGEPYLLGTRQVQRPRGIVLKQEINLSLRRGILVRGVVKETPSGKVVPGAVIEYHAPYNSPFYSRDETFAHDVQTGADGTFAMVVLPGPGHLLVNGPTPDYLHKTILMRELYGPGVSPNRRYYPDGLVALDLKPEMATHRVEVTLKRGVPLKGRVLDPDGKPVASGHLVCRCFVPMGFDINGPRSVPVKDGRFELPGWNADNPDPLYFVCPETGLGGVLHLKAGQADREPTVRLQKFGAAKVRILDEHGKPLVDSRTVVTFPISPGVSFFDPNGFGGKDVTADEAFAGNFDRKSSGDVRTDADGRLELRGLIPGTRHWIIVTRPGSMGMVRVPVDVIPESGKTVDLKNITVKLQFN